MSKILLEITNLKKSFEHVNGLITLLITLILKLKKEN